MATDTAHRTGPIPRRRRVRGDDGTVTAETVIVVPLLWLALFFLLQIGLWGIALDSARNAADGAARDAAAYGATRQDAYASAQSRVDDIAGGLLGDRHVTLTRTATTVSVTVTGTSSLLPLPVSWTSTFPVERFTTNGA